MQLFDSLIVLTQKAESSSKSRVRLERGRVQLLASFDLGKTFFILRLILSVRTKVRMESKLPNLIRIHFQSAACLRIPNLCAFSA